MKDIGGMLMNIMQENNCSSVCALFALAEEKKEDVPVFQSKSRGSLCGGLCTKGNKLCDKSKLVRCIH